MAKTTEIYSLTVLEARWLKSHRAAFPLEALGENLVTAFVSLWGLPGVWGLVATSLQSPPLSSHHLRHHVSVFFSSVNSALPILSLIHI